MRYIRQLGIFFILLVVCSLLILLVYTDVETKTIAEVNSEQRVHGLQAEQGIIRFFATYNSTLAFLAGNRHVIAMDPEGRQLTRDFFSAHSDEISSVTRMSANGTIVYTYPYESSTGADISSQVHVQKSLATHRVVISDVFTSVQGFRTIAFVMPVFANGTYDGGLTILIPFDRLTGKYLEPVRILDNGYAWIINQNGIILYSPAADQIDKPASGVFHNSPSAIAFTERVMTWTPGTSSYTLRKDPGSQDTLTFEAVYLPFRIGDEHWSVIVATPRSEILGTLQTFRTNLGIIFGILVISLFFFTYYITRARGIIKEEEQRQAAEAALRESERNYRSILENMQDVFYRTDHDGTLIMISPSGPRLFGYESEKDMLGKPNTEFYVDPEKRKEVLIAISMHGSVTNHEIQLRRKDGSVITVLANSHRYRDSAGNDLGIEGILRDITDRKRTQTALEQATKKLNLLTSITLNDIKNSLFTLSGYLELEKKQVSEQKRKEYHERELTILNHINAWIDLAGTYRNLGINPPKWQNVTTTFLLAISHLDMAGKGHDIRTNGLEIYADPLLETVFLKLAENTLNHAATATMLILRSEETAAGLTLIFEDNGSGIPDSKKEAVFQRGAGSGKGFGLFMVREILEITGITIRETGVFGNGARFEILVPREGYRFIPEKTGQD